MRCTTEDANAVNLVLSHDAVFPWICDDNPAAQLWRYRLAEKFLKDPSVYVLMPNPWTVFIVECRGSALGEVHTAVLPRGRGKAAVKAGQKAIRWIWNNTDLAVLTSWIPAFNRPARVFARACGLKLISELPDSYRKDGKLVNQVLVGIWKEDS